ncbi:hypothetical protein J0A65_08110 [Bowmanella sp. Y57]|uniref:RNA polymerase sigma-70 region 2 domain-containing protein n=1 Tax=Bowmanella yangjiangensis TaxID=2811230 RepID=A0ABS3CUK6_9ALTE|nr:hypothetical protein [Bowmanella yangjiangensis]
MQKKHAISTAFVAMRSSLERVVGRFVPAREIEDVVQDTYVRILQSEQLDCIKRPESYLYKTAVNLVTSQAYSSVEALLRPPHVHADILHKTYWRLQDICR